MPHVEVAIRRAEAGPETRFRFYRMRGLMHADLRDHEAAMADWSRAEELLDEIPDPRSQRSDLMNAYGLLYADLGEWDRAARSHEQALQLEREMYGEHHPTVAQTLDNLGTVYLAQAQGERALELKNEAARIIQGAHGSDHPIAVKIEINRGSALAELGRLEEAAATYQRAIAAHDRIYGPDHIDSAAARMSLAAVAGRTGEYEVVIGSTRQALRAIERSLGSDHPWIGFGLTNIGTAQKNLGRSKEAVATLERALLLLEDQPANSTELASCKLALAEALVEAGGDESRAVELAKSALAVFPADSSQRRRARRWLDERG
jgi:eukaryotic-like serine/threonine-protein kinase